MSENLFEDDTQTTTQPEMIAWPGGECPAAPRDLVMVEQRDGTRVTAEASTIAWNHLNVASDVMAWRMVQQYDAPETAQQTGVAALYDGQGAKVVEAADASPFAFKMGQYVMVKNGKPGLVIGRAEFHDSEPSYLLRMDTTGNREAYNQSHLDAIS